MIDKDRLVKIIHQVLNAYPELKGFDFSDIINLALRLNKYSKEIRPVFDAYLKENSDLEIFNGGMMNFGTLATRVELDYLWIWLLIRSANKGIEDTVEKLEKYLAIDVVPGYDVLIIEGLQINKILELSSGISLIPVTDLLPSMYKQSFLQKSILTPTDILCQQPKENNEAALICHSSGGRKTRSEAFEGLPTLYNPRTKELEEACFCLTLIDQCCPTPKLHWWDAEEWVPCSPPLGAGGGMPIYDVINRSSFNFDSQENREKAQEIHKLFTAISTSMRQRLKVPLERLNQAKRRVRVVDRAIDLGIALESLLLQEDSSGQIALTFRLRAAWLLGDSNEGDRKANYDLFKLLYECRSKAVHKGELDDNIRGIPTVQVIDKGIQAAAKAIEIIMRQRSFPDWDSLILNITKGG